MRSSITLPWIVDELTGLVEEAVFQLNPKSVLGAKAGCG